MTSTSSSTSHPNFRFDVFLSFRGQDTRHNFTDHLYHALNEAGCRTFRDNDKIERGQELKPEIDAAIIESRASIVVLSENYANSTWCLDELCLIMEQRRKLNHFVLPVFYQVDPSDVRNQRGSFAIKTFANFSSASLINYVQLTDFSKKRSKWTEANVTRWKAALTQVANLTGLELSRSESSFIADVVKTIKHKLELKQLSTPHKIGMEDQGEYFNSWLKNEQSNVIAIRGGQTTITQQIYNFKDVEEDVDILDEVLEGVKEVLEDVEEILEDVDVDEALEGVKEVLEDVEEILEDVDVDEALEGVKEVFEDVEEVLEDVVEVVEEVLKDAFLKLWKSDFF